MKNNISKKLIIILSSIFLTSCMYRNDNYVPDNGHIISGDMVTAGYMIADSLVSGLNKNINKSDPIIVTTFSNIDDLNSSTTFGRMLSEQIASRLSQRGFLVREMKFRQNSIYVSKENGEFMLSRDINVISKDYNASAVVVGTYGESAEGAYVSARIIDPSSSVIISSCDYGVRLGIKRRALLTSKN